MNKKCFFAIVLLIGLSLLFVIAAQAQEAPLPAGTEVILYEPAEYAKAHVTPARMKPIGVGSVAMAGEEVAIQVALPRFEGPVDVYLAIKAPFLNPEPVLVTEDLSLVPLGSGLVPWKEDVTEQTEESLFGTIPVASLPAGTYDLYLMVTPHADPSHYMLYATSFEVPPVTMDPPRGQEFFEQQPTVFPSAHTIAGEARPIGLGSVVSGGDALTVRIALPEFSAPMDVYFGLHWPGVDPSDIYLLGELIQLSPLSSGLVKWKGNVSGAVSEIVLPDIPIAELPPGMYWFYLMVTPAGSTDNYFLWRTEMSSSTLFVDRFGNGTVMNGTGEIGCSDESDHCSASFEPGTVVELTATADADSEFHSWEGCDTVNANTCTVTIDGNKTVYPSFALRETKVSPLLKELDAAAVNLIVREEGSIYYFDPEIMNLVSLQEGDIIVSTIGNGFLRNVIKVSESGGLLKVETEDASLLDAVEEGTFITSPEDFVIDLAKSDFSDGVTVTKVQNIAGKGPKISLKINKTFPFNSVIYENGPVKVRLVGSLAFELKPDMKLSIGFKNWVVPYVKQFRTIIEISNTDKVSVIAQGGWTGRKRVHIGTVRFTPIPLGYIVIVPEAALYLGVDARIGATGSITTAVTLDAFLKAGVVYKRKKGWKTVGTFSKDFTFTPPTLSAELKASAKGYVAPEFSALIYGIVGPFVNLEGYLKMDAWIPPPSWELKAGFQSCVGATQLSLLSKWLPKLYETCPVRYEHTLAQYTAPGRLEVTPSEAFISSGPQGGPFRTSKVYTLKNIGWAPINWKASTSEDWISAKKNNIGWASNTGMPGSRLSQGKAISININTFLDRWSDSGEGELLPGETVKLVVSPSSAATGLSEGTHTGRVHFNNETNHNEDTSRMVTLTVTTSSPTVPGGLNATALSPSEIGLAWTASSDNEGIADYEIERCKGSGCTNFSQIGTTASTNYSDKGLSANTTYAYRVRAFDNDGNTSDYSNTASATTPELPDTTPPTAPGNLTATPHATNSQISLSWTASTDTGGSGLAGYKVERCAGPGCSNFQEIGTPSNLDYDDLGLAGSTTYSYRVRAYDNAGNDGAYSNTASATTPAQADVIPPTAPGNLTATATSSGEIQLTWIPSTDTGGAGLSHYEIERCTGGSCVTINVDAFLSGTPTNGYWGGGLSQNTAYTYRMRAYDNAGNFSDFSNTDSATTLPEEVPPTVPGNLNATPSSTTEIVLSWTGSTDSGGSGLAGYKVERCTGAGCTNFAEIGTSTTTDYADTGLIQNTAYTYRVRAYDNAGNLSGYSAPASTVTSSETIPPTAPGSLAASSQGSTYYVALNWTGSTDTGGSGLAGSKIERCAGLNCTNFVEVGWTVAELTSDSGLMLENGLMADTTYNYRVRAFDNAGNHSGYSNTASATTVPDTIPPWTPQNFSAIAPTLYACDVEISWPPVPDPNGPGNAVGYRIERCGDPFVYAPCSDFSEIANISVTGYTPTVNYTECMVPGAYTYRVRAYDRYDNLSGYSNTSSVDVYELPALRH